MTSIAQTKDKNELKKNLAYMRDKDREIVKGIFKFYEVPGGSMSFNYRKYKLDEVQRYDMVDGQIYSIPLGVAKHLNTSGWYPEHAYSLDENGKPVAKIGRKVRRYGFQSLEFVDMDEFTQPEKEIITVEYQG